MTDHNFNILISSPNFIRYVHQNCDTNRAGDNYIKQITITNLDGTATFRLYKFKNEKKVEKYIGTEI